jgi:hypothetical protein
MSNINELQQSIYNHAGFEVAKQSYLRQIDFEDNSILSECMAEAYALAMVLTNGNIKKSVEFVEKQFEINNFKKILRAIK